MKKLLKIVIVLAITLAVMISAFSTYANESEKNDGTWAFYIYMIDNEKSVETNSRIVKEMGKVTFPSHVSVISESSWNRSLEDFLKYCDSNVKADHKVLIISGQGEGIYGYKAEGGRFVTVDDIKQALYSTYKPTDVSPAFELTILDGDLQATAEMGTVLHGFSKYLIAPESLMYKGEGFYNNWFKEFCLDTTISTVDLGKKIVDCYDKMIDSYYLKDKKIISTDLALIDVDKLNDVYGKYATLAKFMLKRIAKDNLMIGHISRVARRTVTAGDTGDEAYNYNLLDLYDFLYNLSKYFPIEAKSVINALEKSIVYKINKGFLINTFGVSIYFPKTNFKGNDKFIIYYLDKIALNNYISGVYSLKLTGKIDEALLASYKKDGIGKIKPIDYTVFNNFEGLNPTLNGSLTFKYELPNLMKPLWQYAYIEVYKRNASSFTNYGRDAYYRADASNNIAIFFEGKWDTINDTPLYINPVSQTNDYKKYYTRVLYNDSTVNLYNVFDEKAYIPKIVGILDDSSQNTKLVGNVVNTINKDDAITMYSFNTDLLVGSMKPEVSTTFVYNDNYRIENKVLPDGEYTCYVVVEDLKGDKYKGQDILFNIESGHVKDVITLKDLNDKFSK